MSKLNVIKKYCVQVYLISILFFIFFKSHITFITQYLLDVEIYHFPAKITEKYDKTVLRKRMNPKI